MKRLAFFAALLSVPIVAFAAIAQSPDETDASRELDELRMKKMRDRVAALSLTGRDGKPAGFTYEPAWRFDDNPRGIVDASMWILGKSGRPAAVLALEFYDNDTVMYELTSNAEPPQSVRGPNWEWKPQDQPFDWTEIPVKEAPGETAKLRQSQLKLLIREFSASEEFNDQVHQLRILPRPIYEYEDATRGILSGAVFMIANGKNAEILMLVEARAKTDEEPAHWVAGFSRLATASLDVKFAKDDFWSSPNTGDYKPNRPPRDAEAYFSQGDALDQDEREAFRRR